MTRNLKAAAILLLLLPAGVASAHRIDEYLQATLFTLQVDQVQASMRLIPGTLVAASVIAAIDSNGDGAFAASEERAYAKRVLHDLSITTDGAEALPQLTSWSFPSPAQMRAGLGEIHIDYTFIVPAGQTNHTLTVTNHHLESTSVYLMNVTGPPGPQHPPSKPESQPAAVCLRASLSARNSGGFPSIRLACRSVCLGKRARLHKPVPSWHAAHCRGDRSSALFVSPASAGAVAR